MSLKQSFADQVKAQSEVWKAQIKDFQEQPEQASTSSFVSNLAADRRPGSSST
jgi:hypothetical protein